MSEKIFNNLRIIHKHDTEENWLKAVNFIPKQGELIIYDVDNNYNYERMKIGNGKTLVNDLPFSNDWKSLENKPFGEIEKYELIFEKSIYSSIYQDSSNPYCQWLNTPRDILIIGDTYKVVYQDMEYILTCKGTDSYNDPYLGNASILSNQWEDTGEPFLIIHLGDGFEHGYNPGNYELVSGKFRWCHLPSISGGYTGYIYHLTNEIHQLDEKYIPDTIARVSDIKMENEECIINLTQEDEQYVLDKTYDEICAMINNNIIPVIYNQDNNMVYRLFGMNNEGLAFLSERVIMEGSASGLHDIVTSYIVISIDSNNNVNIDNISNSMQSTEFISLHTEDKTIIGSINELHKDKADISLVTGIESALYNAIVENDIEDKAYVDEKIAALPQSNWNQNDETAKDFIKNRPFYEKISLQRFDLTDKFTFESSTSGGVTSQSGAGRFTLPFIFTIGETYKFTINGTEYETTCRDMTDTFGEGALGFGDIDAVLNNDIASVNFFAYGAYNSDIPDEFHMMAGIVTESEITEFAIDGVALNIVKIDKKYLPNSIESINGITPDSDGAISITNSDVGASKVIEVTVTDNKSSMTPKEIADAISEGNIVTLSGAYSYGGDYNNCSTFYKIVRDPDIYVPIIYFAKININKNVTYYSHVIDLESLGLPDDGDESEYLTMTNNGAYIFRSLPVVSTSNGGIKHGRYASKANAAGSVALGRNTIANYVSEYVTGSFNIASTEVAESIPDLGDKGKYIHIVGNGTSDTERSNAHTVDWDGNAWFSGDVYVGSTSGTNKDEGSKKLATEEYVNTKANQTDLDALEDLVGTTSVQSQISSAIADLVDTAPDTLDTLGELATAIQENDSVIDTLDAAITNKADKTEVEALKTQVTATSLILADAITGQKYEIQIQNGQLVSFPVEE